MKNCNLKYKSYTGKTVSARVGLYTPKQAGFNGYTLAYTATHRAVSPNGRRVPLKPSLQGYRGMGGIS